MRIAITGSHLVGKTSLAEALAAALPGYELVPEPYHLLEEDGHEFAEMPSLEDFELQLERAFQSVAQSGDNAVLDRCPLDILGYLLTHEDTESFEPEDWLARVRESVATLDLLVFVPIEEPDRIAVPRAQAQFRAEVDGVLRDVIVDDAYGHELDVLTVTGSPSARLRQVLEHLRK